MNHEKMVPKLEEIGEKQGDSTCSYIWGAFYDLELLVPLTNFKSTCRGVSFLIILWKITRL